MLDIDYQNAKDIKRYSDVQRMCGATLVLSGKLSDEGARKKQAFKNVETEKVQKSPALPC